MVVRIFLSIFAPVNQQINENENENKNENENENVNENVNENENGNGKQKRKRKNYDKRRTNVQRGAAAEGNSEMQSADDGLCDDGHESHE